MGHLERTGPRLLLELNSLLALQRNTFWHFGQFEAMALARQGHVDEAVRYAESHFQNVYDSGAFAAEGFCEQVLLAAGRRDEAYRRYGLAVTGGTTNLAAYRALLQKYPEQDPRQALLDLIDAGAGRASGSPLPRMLATWTSPWSALATSSPSLRR